MFKMIENPTLTNLGIDVLNFAVKKDFPFVEGIVRRTLFEQFAGGETREKSKQVVSDLHRHHIGSIFDYAIEGKEDEELEIIRVRPQDAYYWDTKHNRVVVFAKMVAGALTGKTLDDSIEGTLRV